MLDVVTIYLTNGSGLFHASLSMNWKLQFAIGIDSERFKRALELPAVKEHINELRHRFSGRKVRSTIIFYTSIFFGKFRYQCYCKLCPLCFTSNLGG